MSNRISAVLLLSLATLLAVIALELRGGVPAPERTVSAAAPGPSALPPPKPIPIAPPPLGILSETRERPLFTDGRKPPVEDDDPAPVASAARPVAESGDVVVSAIVMTPEERAVLLSFPSSGGVVRVAEGEEAGGWKLKKVESDRAILIKNGEIRNFALRSFGPPPPPRQKVNDRLRRAQIAAARNADNVSDIRRRLRQRTDAAVLEEEGIAH